MPTAVDAWLRSLPEGTTEEARRQLVALTGVVTQGDARFLLGAGMSIASGAPLTSDLSRRMAAEISEGHHSPLSPSADGFAGRYPFEAIAETYAKLCGRPALNDLFRDEIGKAAGGPHAGHDAINQLAASGYIDRIYTTNFDRLIEDAISLRARSISDSNVETLPVALREGFLPVMHLHGAIESNNCLAEESETTQLDTPLGRLLAAEMVLYSFVFVGYSLSDWDLHQIYQESRRMAGRRHRRSYIIHPLSEHSAREYRFATKVWDARGAIYLPGTAELVLPALLAQVNRRHAERLCVAIAKKKGSSPTDTRELEAIWKEAEDLAAAVGAPGAEAAMKALAVQYEIEL